MSDQRHHEPLPVWMIGQRYWKVGDHEHVWVVDAVEPGTAGQAPFALLVTSDGLNAEEVDLSHLDNPGLYTPVQADAVKTD